MINKRNRNTILVGKQEGRGHCEDLGIDRTGQYYNPSHINIVGENAKVSSGSQQAVK